MLDSKERQELADIRWELWMLEVVGITFTTRNTPPARWKELLDRKAFLENKMRNTECN